MFRSRIPRWMELLQRTVHKTKQPIAADSLVNCTQATTTAGERSVPLISPTCVQMKMHVRTEKTTAVSRTARHTDRSVGYSVRRGYAEHKREAHPRDRARPVAGPTRRANGNPHSGVVICSGLYIHKTFVTNS